MMRARAAIVYGEINYFNEPCTTAAAKKTGTPSFCTPTWLMIFAFFCKLFGQRSYRT